MIATTEEEVLQCASSKYAATPTLAALNRAVKIGLKRLGVVATPCQALAVAQMRANPMAEKHFQDPVDLVIGLFCTWSLDFRAFSAFLEGRCDVNTIQKIDIPPPPAEVMEVFTTKGKEEYPLGEIRQLVPASCACCLDMTSEFSDIAVGVVEGRQDRNTLIVRSPRGQQIVDEASKEGWLVLEDLPEKNLEHLRWAARQKKQRGLARGMEEGLVNTPDGQGLAALRLDEGICGEIRAQGTEDKRCHS